jgi:hypothetical protein
MRHVLVNDRAHDRIPEQKLARELLRDKAKFFDRLAGLEKAESVAKAAARSAREEESDPGEERARAVLNRLIGECKEQQAREDAEFAARPDAAKIGPIRAAN